jgi:hypothetical protein
LANTDVVSIITIKRRFNNDVISYSTHRGNRRSLRWRDDMLTRLKDISEKACPFFGRNPIVRIGATIKAPTGSVATLALKNKLLVEGEIMATSKHFLLLGSWPGGGSKV